jgi:hypothetical protein
MQEWYLDVVRKMNRTVARKKRKTLRVSFFSFLFKSGPLSYFLPHVTYLGKRLEEKEDKQMELISTPNKWA